ncbi:hypothetical protein HDV02_001465 [Globomyces sp. JEL0801]|nr:hypothetical protein HDV02_001465 [Globomyces sp. JEL0801]
MKLIFWIVLLWETHAVYTPPAFLDVELGFLSSTRKNIYPIPYTAQQRSQIANSVHTMFQLYGHRYAKMEDFGTAIDPIPRSLNLTKTASSMKDAEFHSSFIDLFKSLRDEHTVYYMPAPQACYITTTGLGFSLTGLSSAEDPVVVVSKYTNREKVLEFSPQVSQAKLGDRLLMVDGVPFKTWAEQNKWKNGGANPSAVIRIALNELFTKTLVSEKVPEKDSIVFTLQKSDSTTYKLELPWVTIADKFCISNVAPYLKNPSLQPRSLIVPESKGRTSLQDIINTNRQVITRPLKTINYRDTQEPKIQWGIFKKSEANLGVLRIGSFSTYQLPEAALLMIRDIIFRNLADTNGLLIDVRQNTGGLVDLAQMLPQLFIPENVGIKARAIANPLNKKFMVTQGPHWAEAANQINDGDYYTPIVTINPNSTIRRYGQVYLKPVGVLTDAICYSACDMFSANMQDNGAGTIFGEDVVTGAGGGNVLDYSYIASLLPNDMQPLPFADKLAYAPALSIAWGQSIRIGPNAGRRIEGFGVTSDYIVRPTQSDITGQNSDTQFDRIADKLKEIALKKKNGNLAFKSTSSYIIQNYVDSPIKLVVNSVGLKKISVKGLHTTTQDTSVTISNLIEPVESTFILENNYELGNYQFGFTAVDAIGRSILNTTRLLQVVLPLESYVTLPRTPLTFENAPFAIYNMGSSLADPSAGWVYNKINQAYQIGDGKSYIEYVNTKLSLFCNAGTSVHIEIKGSYQTESQFDTFRIVYIDDFGFHDLLPNNAVSGQDTFDINRDIITEGQFELFFEFISDGGVNDRGVLIEKFSISDANGPVLNTSLDPVTSSTITPTSVSNSVSSLIPTITTISMSTTVTESSTLSDLTLNPSETSVTSVATTSTPVSSSSSAPPQTTSTRYPTILDFNSLSITKTATTQIATLTVGATESSTTNMNSEVKPLVVDFMNVSQKYQSFSRLSVVSNMGFQISKPMLGLFILLLQL